MMFKAGQSGNPKGKPKGARDRRNVILSALAEVFETDSKEQASEAAEQAQEQGEPDPDPQEAIDELEAMLDDTRSGSERHRIQTLLEARRRVMFSNH